jgi:pimeloyl-ACP methyl ester carboxylesterase
VETLTLADGRDLSYDTYGEPDGLPVVFSHGLGDSRLLRHPDDELTASLGVRMIAADEPGVGGSTRQRGRRMVDWGGDMEQLADALGLGTFAVAGHSGGGPHALSIAVHLPDRVTHGVLASPVGPFDREGFAKMLISKDLKLLVKLRHLHRLIDWAYKAEIKYAKGHVPSLAEAAAKEDHSDADTILGDPAQRAMFEANFDVGLAQDEEGVYEMTMALWNWGFELEDVRQPFDVFYGDDDDIIAPEMPLHVAEHLPNGKAHVWPGAGHYGFVDRARWIEFLEALTAR